MASEQKREKRVQEQTYSAYKGTEKEKLPCTRTVAMSRIRNQAGRDEWQRQCEEMRERGRERKRGLEKGSEGETVAVAFCYS